MSLLDLKVARRAQNKESAAQWEERDRRLQRLTSLTTDSQTYTTMTNVVESSGIKQQQIMDMELLESAKCGDVDNFIFCLERFSKDKNTHVSVIFSQLTVPGQNTFLHVAASCGNEDLVLFIADHYSELLTCRNHQGDSALHLAARAGQLGVVSMLLGAKPVNQHGEASQDNEQRISINDSNEEELYKNWVQENIAVNDEGNTALHEAMLYHRTDVVHLLIKSNLEAAYYVNKEGKSPLYMAVETADIEYVRNIFLGVSKFSRALLDKQLTEGKSLLHAATRRKSIGILQEILMRKPMLIYVRDENGLRPQDFASSVFPEGVIFLEDWLNKIITSGGEVNLDDDRELRIEGKMQLWEKSNDILHDLICSQRVPISPEGRPHLGRDQPMNTELYECAKNGMIDEFLNILTTKNFSPSLIYNQKTPLQNTFVHVAASFGNEMLAGFIVHHFRSFLSIKNYRGDTALHVAAASGHLGTVVTLLEFQSDQMRKESLQDVHIARSREIAIGKFKERVVVNDDGNTPLHEAMMNNHWQVADYLIKEKIEDAYHVNKHGKSPLHLAIEANNNDYVLSILSTRLVYPYQHVLYEEVTKGNSLVHAAITSRNIVILQEITKMKAEVIHIKDENGQKPLHYAASTNFAEGFQFLLDKDKMVIFEKDSYGLFPIHCACKYGHVDILENLLQNCLNVKEFVNRDGQNILHVAAKYGKIDVVKYILETPGLQHLLNEKDKEGNTPSHLATKNWYPMVVSCLTWDRRVDLELINNEGFTALEVAEDNMDGVTSFRQRLTWTALMSAGARRNKLRKKQKLEGLKSAVVKPYNMDPGKDRVNTLMLVSILIATVTFAAGFTMPGGYNSSNGMATLINKIFFQVFVICDTIALYSAILVSVTLIWAQLSDLTLVINSLTLALPLLMISLTMMSLAFMAGVYVVVSELGWLSVVVLILGLISLLCLLTLFIPFITPLSSNHFIARYLSYYPFCLLMWVSESYFYNDIEHVEPYSTSTYSTAAVTSTQQQILTANPPTGPATSSVSSASASTTTQQQLHIANTSTAPETSSGSSSASTSTQQQLHLAKPANAPATSSWSSSASTSTQPQLHLGNAPIAATSTASSSASTSTQQQLHLVKPPTGPATSSGPSSASIITQEKRQDANPPAAPDQLN